MAVDNHSKTFVAKDLKISIGYRLFAAFDSPFPQEIVRSEIRGRDWHNSTRIQQKTPADQRASFSFARGNDSGGEIESQGPEMKSENIEQQQSRILQKNYRQPGHQAIGQREAERARRIGDFLESVRTIFNGLGIDGCRPLTTFDIALIELRSSLELFYFAFRLERTDSATRAPRKKM